MHLTKQQVVARVKELAAANGGSVGYKRFLRETGIPDQRLRHQPWYEGWNALLREIGIQTSNFGTPRTSDDEVIASVAGFIKRSGEWPTEDAFARERKRDPGFPSLPVIRRVRRSGKLLAGLKTYSQEESAYEVVRSLAAAQAPEDVHEVLVGESPEVAGYVYMLRYGRQYKIGFTTSPVRRYREVSIELPDETAQVHTIPTDDPKGIENYWHRRFSGKRIRDTEWFRLDSADVRAFKRRNYQ